MGRRLYPSAQTGVAAIATRFGSSILGILFLVSCNAPEEETARGPAQFAFYTWESESISYDEVPGPRIEADPEPGYLPVIGTVSHHLLAGTYIDLWFRTLRSIRDVDTFILLSPRHHGIGVLPVSTTRQMWAIGNGYVESETKIVDRLLAEDFVGIEDAVFEFEHGVQTIVPFIDRYFPDAGVAALAYDGEPPVDLALVARLYDTVADCLAGDPQSIFVLISVDFSHQKDINGTAAADLVSRRYLESNGKTDWLLIEADNRPGIYILDRFMSELDGAVLTIHSHSSSYEISGESPENVTSYFNTFVSVRNRFVLP